MEGNGPYERDEERQKISLAGIGYHSARFHMGGVHASADDYPECLMSEEFECGMCTFFSPRNCRLRREPAHMQDVKTMFALWREQRVAHLAHQMKLLNATRAELASHGRPLHYMVLTRIVGDRYPELQVTDQGILMIMVHHTGIFEQVAAGVYSCL